MIAVSDLPMLLERTGALQKGHFALTAGMHSPQYIQCAQLLQYPDVAADVCRAIGERFRSDRPEVVIGPAMGAMIVAYEVARVLGVRGIFVERVNGIFELRRSFQIRPGERTLIVEDVVTTGTSTNEVRRVVTQSGGNVIGVGAIIDRSATPPQFGVRFEALLKLKTDLYSSEECPLCRGGMPLSKPGSRPTQAPH